MQTLASWFTVEKEQKSICGRDVRKGQNFKLLDVSKDEKSIKVSISGHPDDAVIVSADCVSTLAVLPGTMKDDKQDSKDFSVKKGEMVRVYRISSDRLQLEIELSNGKRVQVPRSKVDIAGGWPFVVMQEYNAAGANQLTVKRHEWGKVFEVDPTCQWARVGIADRKGQQVGHIPLAVMVIGNGRRYGDWKTIDDTIIESTAVIRAPLTRPEGQTLLERAIDGLLAAFHDNQHSLDLVLSEWVDPRIDTQEKRRNLTACIIDGYKNAGLFDVLKNGDFTMQAILDAGTDIKHGLKADGLYLRFYTDVVAAPPQSDLHIGSSKDIDNCNRSHDKINPGKAGAHGTATRNCQWRRAISLSSMKTDFDEWRYLAEQVTFLLFGNYNDRLFRDNQKPDTQSSDALQNVADQLDSSEEPPEGLEMDGDDAEDGEGQVEKAERRRGNWRVYKMAARALTAIADKTLPALGWTPAIQRPSFAGSRFGTIRGLNFQSPATAESSQMIFTKTYLPQHALTLYSRRSCVMSTAGQICQLGSASRRTGHCVKFTLPAKVTPPVGTKVYLVFEITDSLPHPQNWAGLPTVCAYDDAKRASTLAVRAMWKSPSTEGRYETVYCFAGGEQDKKFTFDASQPGSIVDLGRAIGILNFLQRCELVQDRRCMDVRYGIAKVVQVSFDNLQQALVKKQDDPIRKVQAGHLRPAAQIAQDLKDAGAEKVGGEFGKFTAKHTGQRKKCDRCYLHELDGDRAFRKVDVASAACTRVPGKTSCVSCDKAGIPCTWTDTDALKQNEALQLALLPRAHSFKVLTIADPKSHSVGSLFMPEKLLVQGSGSGK